MITWLKDVLSKQIRRAKAEHQKQKASTTKRWLFPSRGDTKPIDIRNPWDKARDNAELIGFRFHDLRHSRFSYLAMSGASQREVAQMPGQRTPQMVKRYSHLLESHILGLVTKLDQDLF